MTSPTAAAFHDDDGDDSRPGTPGAGQKTSPLEPQSPLAALLGVTGPSWFERLLEAQGSSVVGQGAEDKMLRVVLGYDGECRTVLTGTNFLTGGAASPELPHRLPFGDRLRNVDPALLPAELAVDAVTPKDLGRAFGELLKATGRTQGDVVRHDNGRWLSRSTVSRVVNGATVCRNREQVAAIVAACGADRYADIWVDAWQRVRDYAQEHRGTATDAAGAGEGDHGGRREPAAEDAQPLAASSGPEPHLVSVPTGTSHKASGNSKTSSPPADGVLLDVHIRVTQEHVRAAAPLLLAMGILTVANGELPSGRTLALMALTGAAGLALLTHMQRLAQAADTAASTTAEVSFTAPTKKPD